MKDKRLHKRANEIFNVFRTHFGFKNKYKIGRNIKHEFSDTVFWIVVLYLFRKTILLLDYRYLRKRVFLQKENTETRPEQKFVLSLDDSKYTIFILQNIIFHIVLYIFFSMNVQKYIAYIIYIYHVYFQNSTLFIIVNFQINFL